MPGGWGGGRVIVIDGEMSRTPIRRYAVALWLHVPGFENYCPTPAFALASAAMVSASTAAFSAVSAAAFSSSVESPVQS